MTHEPAAPGFRYQAPKPQPASDPAEDEAFDKICAGEQRLDELAAERAAYAARLDAILSAVKKARGL